MSEVKILFWMVNPEGDRKPIVRADVQKELEAKGWKVEGAEKEPSERDTLKVKATELGLTYPQTISTTKLAELVAEAEKKAAEAV